MSFRLFHGRADPKAKTICAAVHRTILPSMVKKPIGGRPLQSGQFPILHLENMVARQAVTDHANERASVQTKKASVHHLCICARVQYLSGLARTNSNCENSKIKIVASFFLRKSIATKQRKSSPLSFANECSAMGPEVARPCAGWFVRPPASAVVCSKSCEQLPGRAP